MALGHAELVRQVRSAASGRRQSAFLRRVEEVPGPFVRQTSATRHFRDRVRERDVAQRAEEDQARDGDVLAGLQSPLADEAAFPVLSR